HTRFSRDWSSDVCSSDLWAGSTSGTVRIPAARSATPKCQARVRHRCFTSGYAPPHELHERPDRDSGRSLGYGHQIRFRVCRAGDIQVHPRIIAHELLEKECGGYGTGGSATGVLYVRHIALDLVAILAPHREGPARLPRATSASQDLGHELLIRAEHANSSAA